MERRSRVSFDDAMHDVETARDLVSYAAGLLPERFRYEAASPDEEEAFVQSAVKWAYRERGEVRPEKVDSVRRTFAAVARGVEVSGADLDPGDLEAIILPALRPVGDVDGGKVILPDGGEFADFTSDPAVRGRIERAIASVGCVALPRHPSLPYGGTAFVVGKDLVMTNRHVAEVFAQGVGARGLWLRKEYGVCIDLRRERPDQASPTWQVTGVVMIHPYWDMALLRVEGLSGEPLELAPHDVAASPTRVAVIGYPAFDARNPTDVQMSVMNGRFQVKRVSPGYVNRTVRVDSFGRRVTAISHDASTLGGSSGSCLVDASTGHVIGLHFGGRYKQTNWAVPVAELAKDRRVIDAGVRFTEARRDDAAPWIAHWDDTEETPAAASSLAFQPQVAVAGGQAQQGPSSPGTVRVTVPIEITIHVGRPTP